MSGRSSKARQMEHIQNKITTYKHMQIPLHSIELKDKSSSVAGLLKKLIRASPRRHDADEENDHFISNRLS
uniref:Uncharacterized protein n=1 Tax=Arion vulgaris TaxID=1028688 RepID=A0A0B7BL43_9EUPU